MTNAQSQPPGQGRGARLSRIWKVALSIPIAFHVTAVFVAPWSFPPPSSRFSQVVAEPLFPYLEAAHLHNGYRFFAPQPGPSHLVEYELTFADGTKRAGRFPDLKEQWPRLLYHRHFMLSEFLASSLPRDPPTDLDPRSPAFRDLQANQRLAQKQFDLYANAFAQHLLHASGAQRAKLTIVQHDFPPPVEFAPEAYREEGEPEMLPSADPLHDRRYFHNLAEFTAEAAP